MVINQWQLNLTQYWDHLKVLQLQIDLHRFLLMNHQTPPITITWSNLQPRHYPHHQNKYALAITTHSINVNLNATPRFNKTKLLKNITKPTNSATSTLNKVASSRTKIPKLINPPNLNCFKLRKIQFIIVQIKRNYL